MRSLIRVLATLAIGFLGLFAGFQSLPSRDVCPVVETKHLETEIEALYQLVNQMNTHLRKRNVGWGNCLRFRYDTTCGDGQSNASSSGLPCRSDILVDLLVSLEQAMNEINVVHWIGFGTLLGAVRDGRIIPWTGDADVLFVVSPNYTIHDFGAMLSERLSEQGLYVFVDRDMVRVCISFSSRRYGRFVDTNSSAKPGDYPNLFPYADLYPVRPDAKRPDVLTLPLRCYFPTTIVLPPSTIEMYGHKLSAPADPLEYVTRTYGPNFRTPPDKQTLHGDHPGTCRNEWQTSRKPVAA